MTDRLRDRSQCELTPIQIRQSQYLNNRIGQDHRAIKRRIRLMLGFQSMASARVILSGIEMMREGRRSMPASNSDRLPNSLTYSQHEPITNICYFLVPPLNLRRNPCEIIMTVQIPDRIILEEAARPLFCEPPILESEHDLKCLSAWVIPNTGLRREYIATWAVRGGILYLEGLGATI
jgi:hypothetical protein